MVFVIFCYFIFPVSQKPRLQPVLNTSFPKLSLLEYPLLLNYLCHINHEGCMVGCMGHILHSHISDHI